MDYGAVLDFTPQALLKLIRPGGLIVGEWG